MKWLWLLLLPSLSFADQVRIQVLIQENTEVGRFQDALYYAPETFPGEGSKEVQAARQARIDSYVDAVKSPGPPPPEPTKEELQKLSADLQASIDQVIAQKAEVDARISTKGAQAVEARVP